MKRSEAKKLARETGKPQRVTEPEPTGEVKVQISLRLDADVLNRVKAESDGLAIPYQTWINSILKQHLDRGEAFKRMIQQLEGFDLQMLDQRVQHLEEERKRA